MTRRELAEAIKTRQSFLCVGLDTDPLRLPAHLPRTPEGVLMFNQAIVDATRDHCVAYKPNTAFYEAMGPAGWEVLQETVRYIGDGHFVIADAKRGDIGNTADQYARAFFELLGCDAVTVAPYMGRDSVVPFLQYPGKWAIVLALTSNPGHEDFQTRRLSEGDHLYEEVIARCSGWGSPENTMFVVGATREDYLRRVRELLPEHFFLVPGVGAQGGDLATVYRLAANRETGLLVNASRSILYASAGEDFAEKAEEEAASVRREMIGLMQAAGVLA